MKSESLSLKEAQRLILNSQNLIGAKLSPLQVIEHLGYVQIDTISVVERAHHHVFWTRCPSYRPSDLGDLVSSRKVFEYWSHAASFLPMNEYRYSLPMKKGFTQRESSWFPKNPKLMKMVLKRIKEEGPLRSIDFKRDKSSKSSGWWDWKPTKKALERLFMEGKLEITRREGFQKVYDLPERVIPDWVDRSFPTKKEHIRFSIHRILRHHGLATAREIGYLQQKAFVDAIKNELKSMVSSGELVEVRVESVEDLYYAFPDVIDRIPKVSAKILIFSPFDNFIIQRKKLHRFFNYDYQIECYLPEPKRKYGYFCLPIFDGVKPLGRMDCKVDRNKKTIFVQSIHGEKGIHRDGLKSKIHAKLKAFAKFNNCSDIEY